MFTNQAWKYLDAGKGGGGGGGEGSSEGGIGFFVIQAVFSAFS